MKSDQLISYKSVKHVIAKFITKILPKYLQCLALFTAFFVYAKTPRVSVITSVYKADKYLVGFLKDLTRQTIFADCEFIIINANSPGSEHKALQKFARKYKNVRYSKLSQDPGLYAVWNQAIKLAHSEFITNWNVDDRRNPNCLDMHAMALEHDLAIDLVYSDFYLTRFANEFFESDTRYFAGGHREFSKQNMSACLPGPMPMWRKSMHQKYGYFDENYAVAGDYEMWLRAVSKGSVFKKVPGFAGIFYLNPHGLSYNWDPKKIRTRALESKKIEEIYGYLWK